MMMCGLHTQLFGGVAYTFYRLPVPMHATG
jgi:hypothetical protein